MLARNAPHDETLVESRTGGHRFRSGLMCSDLDRVVLIFGAAVTCAAEAPTLSNFVRDRVSQRATYLTDLPDRPATLSFSSLRLCDVDRKGPKRSGEGEERWAQKGRWGNGGQL
jgi:hypothetical protein